MVCQQAQTHFIRLELMCSTPDQLTCSVVAGGLWLRLSLIRLTRISGDECTHASHAIRATFLYSSADAKSMHHELHQLPVPPYSAVLVHRALQTSGYPLMIAERQVVEFDSEISFAHGRRPFHELVYAAQYRGHAVHFITNAALKIVRFYTDPPERRFLPCSASTGTLPPAEHQELEKKWPQLPPEQMAAAAEFIYRGLVRQVTSMPLDLRVERELHQVLPEHRPLQQAYLRQQVQDFEPCFLSEMAEAVPELVHTASTAMNVAFAEEVAELAGVPIGRRCQTSPCRPLGEKLLAILREVHEPGSLGDRVVTDRWASELGVRDWYAWTRLGDVT